MLPPLRHIAFFLTAFALPSASSAEPRDWKNTNGQRSIQGEFVERKETSVSIRRGDGKLIAIPLDKLHPDDRSWIDAHHPMHAPAAPEKPTVFDQLSFGDTRAEVLRKLMASKFVTRTTSEAYITRTGLNGVFHTREKIGGLDAALYFDWTENGELAEITLQTAPLPASRLNDNLAPCWKEFIELLSTLHGKPANANNRLDITPLQDGAMSGTHLWKLEPSGSVLLGPAREGDQYQIAVRFTTEDIKPVVVPASSSAAP